MTAPPLEGLEAQTHAFLHALDRGRLHHAWLLTGPQGSGKAGFAYLAAGRLLGAARVDAETLDAPPGDPVMRMIVARSHPDLLVLERETGEGGPARRSIPVDEARRLPEFFAKSPAIGRYRVAIIDSVDDLNTNAANAILKTLEEPSACGVLLLISHAPGRLLPTIRSRCRRLAFPPWPSDRLVAFVRARTELDGEEAERLAELAHGAPGRALALAADGALALDRQAAAILAALPGGEAAELLALADGFRGGEGARRFAQVLERLADRIREAAADPDASGSGAANERWSAAWERLTALPGEVEGLNLDRSDAFWSLMAHLRAIAAQHPFAPPPRPTR